MRNQKCVKSLALRFTLILCAAAIPPRANAATDPKTEWERTLEAAKKEAGLVLYVSSSYGQVFEEFQKKYPQIKVVAVRGTGNQVAGRVMAERRAGKYLADLYFGGSGTAYNVFYKGEVLDPIKPMLILPEVVDESLWWSGRHVYNDDESSYILGFSGIVQSFFSYNTKLVNPKEFKSYFDFLDPKWRGKIVSYDPTMGGGGVSGILLFMYHNPKLGPGFIRRFLTETDLTASRDSRQIVDWLAVGKLPIAALVPPDGVGIYDAKKQGLPVEVFDSRSFKEGAPFATSSGNMALFNKAPHPNAARVAINWILSREGQIAYQKHNPDKDSLREDIPKDGVLPHVRREKGVDYLVLAGPGFKDMDPVDRIVREVWMRK